MSEIWSEARLDHRNRQAANIAMGALSLLADDGGSALSMAAVANRAGISRQTLYRYYKDLDALLVGVAEAVASHDEEFEGLVRDLPDPSSQLELIARAVADHDEVDPASLTAIVPPEGREVLEQHMARVRQLVAEILGRGIESGIFDEGLDPDADARLILGLLAAAEPGEPERALHLLRKLVLSHNSERSER